MILEGRMVSFLFFPFFFPNLVTIVTDKKSQDWVRIRERHRILTESLHQILEQLIPEITIVEQVLEPFVFG